MTLHHLTNTGCLGQQSEGCRKQASSDGGVADFKPRFYPCGRMRTCFKLALYEPCARLSSMLPERLALNHPACHGKVWLVQHGQCEQPSVTK